MRILLDESVPHRIGRLLVGHVWSTVQREGWAGTKNGKLLQLASARFDVLVTADQGMEYQQDQTNLPMAVLVVVGKTNRLEDLVPLVPSILEAISSMSPKSFRRLA